MLTSILPTINNYNISKDNSINFNSPDITIPIVDYLNARINSTFNIERFVNKYIYYYITQTEIAPKFNQKLYDYINTHTLYDYVKMYSINYLNSKNIVYELNMSIYQNDIVNQIYNFSNWTDEKALLNNPTFIDCIF